PILETAGWRDIAFRAHDLEMEIGVGEGTAEARAVELCCRIGPMARRLQEAPEAEAELRRVLAPKLTPHVRDGAVRLPGRLRVITALA
ncbi:MAG: hypothetical protein AAGF44_02505, partial [Pseudomonadota bacterium]